MSSQRHVIQITGFTTAQTRHLASAGPGTSKPSRARAIAPGKSG
ncbi:hypothetical protein TPY_0852 [Sulfobacillus acidophilus TPY]|nr:hypothetical protein TPY_0852 [Sulfobacillus acidophilus TPY]